MIWKKDKLKPVQPYMVIDKENYIQRLSDHKDISHFYKFSESGMAKSRIVPDGAIDLLFEYGTTGSKVHVCGTNLEYSTADMFDKSVIFGVRFMPGVLPGMLDVKIGELTGKRLDYYDINKGDTDWICEMIEESDFAKQIQIFEKAYGVYGTDSEALFGKEKIVNSTKNLIYESDGKIRISEIEEQTGYSERYINKVFSEEMGFSPKTFCKIIQFQRALEYLDYGAPGKMTDASVKLGFYDQSQFIKDFKRYAGITPKKYLDMVEGIDYKNLMRRSIV